MNNASKSLKNCVIAWMFLKDKGKKTQLECLQPYGSCDNP